MRSEPGLWDGLVEDGRPLLQLSAVMLLLSGLFALFLSGRREFLPHDVAFLGISAERLCQIAECRVVNFMFHDRVAFGGTLIAVAVLYLWLAAFPLREGARWAWWTVLLSGTLGFGSFLAYLGYGYLDDWHGVATLALLPVFAIGLWRTRTLARLPALGWLRTPEGRAAGGAVRLGRMGLVATGLGMVSAGAVILVVGASRVFVPQDLAYIGMSREALDAVNPNLIPLIAHDRAGFGGGLASAGILVTLCAWYARPSRAFRQAILISGSAGFGCAIGVHYLAGYTDWTHLAPALAGAGLFLASVTLEKLGSPGITPP
jgi:hypothetical protein